MQFTQEQLTEIVLTDADWKVRMGALEKLTDENLLLEVANNCNKSKLIVAIINKISKENIKKIKSSNWYIKAICQDILNK